MNTPHHNLHPAPVSAPHKRVSYSRGYTLLFAVIASVLVLGVGIFILGVSRKQYILASTARESMFSFYAADSAIECAAAAAAAGNLATSSDPTDIHAPLRAPILSCGGAAVATQVYAPVTPPTGYGTTYPTFGSLNNQLFFSESGSCAMVSIYDGYDDSGNHLVTIDARGYNISDASGGALCYQSSARTVERALFYSIYN